MMEGLNNSAQQEALPGLDFHKIWIILKKSIFWILLIVVTTNLLSYLYLRYTKPMYESRSELKLDVKSEASALGFNTIDASNLNNISGEIELIRSKLFFEKVLDEVDLSTAYFTYGKLLDDERYKTSPFKVDYHIKTRTLYNRPIDITVVGSTEFKLAYSYGDLTHSGTYKFGNPVSTPDIELTAELTRFWNKEFSENEFYFIGLDRNAQISYLQNNISVQPLNLQANTILITFKDHNQNKAFDLVNKIDSIYLEYTALEKSLENKNKIDYLNDRLRVTGDTLEHYEDYFENFTITNQTVDLGQDVARTISLLNKLDSQRVQLNSKIEAIERFDKLVASRTLDSLRPMRGFPAHITSALDELMSYRVNTRSLEGAYTENTYAYQKSTREFGILLSDLVAAVSSHKGELYGKLQELNIQKIALSRDLRELPSINTDFNKTQRFYNLYEEIYLSLIQSKNEFEIAQAGTTTDFKILSSATKPIEPISPHRLIVWGIGLVSGMVLSLFFVAIKYVLFDTVNFIGDIERLTSASVLGTVPLLNEKIPIAEHVIDRYPKSAVSESLRAIRTNLEFMVLKEGPKVYSVSSTVGGEGKTFISVNLGGIIALSDKKVVVVDLDMRKPKVHLAFGDKQRSVGLSTLLIGKTTIEESVIHTSHNNLFYVGSGPTPPNPSELILSPKFTELIEDLKKSFDVVILDTPPVGLVTDGVLAMKHADLPIYILKADYSQTRYLQNVNRLKEGSFKNLTVILNGVKNSKFHNYGYGYGYYSNSSS